MINDFFTSMSNDFITMVYEFVAHNGVIDVSVVLMITKVSA